MRWYLIALLSVRSGNADLGGDIRPASSGNTVRWLAEVAAVFVLQLVLFQLGEEIGVTGFCKITGRTGTTQ